MHTLEQIRDETDPQPCDYADALPDGTVLTCNETSRWDCFSSNTGLALCDRHALSHMLDIILTKMSPKNH